MRFGRLSGVLLHPTSLPGPEGIGTLGAEAYRFADFLTAAGQRIWQVLPLGPTGYGDSPYQCLSAFAGNHLLIDLQSLAADGLIDWSEVAPPDSGLPDSVNYGAVIHHKERVVGTALDRFDRNASPADRDAFASFQRAHAAWLEDFSLFMAAKAAHGGVAWTGWEPALAARDPGAMDHWCRQLEHEIRTWQFAQFVFFRQWESLRRHCHARRLRIMGDVPIFVAHDSADVWAHRDLFRLEADGSPTAVAGVPPDYFSATGQLWGNPLYRWDAMAEGGFRWWIARLAATFAMVDIVRLDHFRGFEAFWEIPADAQTAISGRWVKGPGAALFDALRDALGELPMVAENLGVITPEVERLRTRYGFPGMAILQFAFGTDPQAPSFRPHNYTPDRAVFTGTHDNDTIVGWWTEQQAGHSTRTQEDIAREHEYAREYLNVDGEPIHWVFIRAAVASVAELALVPMQDVLGLGNEARMNVPARATGNWRWRMRPGAATDALAEKLHHLSSLFERNGD